MKTRFTDEQIIQMIKEQEAGEKTADVCRRYGISQGTFYKYKSKYGGMEPSDAKTLRALKLPDADFHLPDSLIAGHAVISCHGDTPSFEHQSTSTIQQIGAHAITTSNGGNAIPVVEGLFNDP